MSSAGPERWARDLKKGFAQQREAGLPLRLDMPKPSPGGAGSAEKAGIDAVAGGGGRLEPGNCGINAANASRRRARGLRLGLACVMAAMTPLSPSPAQGAAASRAVRIVAPSQVLFPSLAGATPLQLNWLPSLEATLRSGVVAVPASRALLLETAILGEARRAQVAAVWLEPPSASLVRELQSSGISTLPELDGLLDAVRSDPSQNQAWVAKRDALVSLRYRASVASPLAGHIEGRGETPDSFMQKSAAERGQLLGHVIKEHSTIANELAQRILAGKERGGKRTEFLSKRGIAELVTLHAPYLDDGVAKNLWLASEPLRRQHSSRRIDLGGARTALRTGPTATPDSLATPEMAASVFEHEMPGSDAGRPAPPSRVAPGAFPSVEAAQTPALPPSIISPTSSNDPRRREDRKGRAAQRVQAALAGDLPQGGNEIPPEISGIRPGISDEVPLDAPFREFMESLSKELSWYDKEMLGAASWVLDMGDEVRAYYPDSSPESDAWHNAMEFLRHTYYTTDIPRDAAFVDALASLIPRLETATRLHPIEQADAWMERIARLKKVGNRRHPESLAYGGARPFKTHEDFRPVLARFTLYAKAILEYDPALRTPERELLKRHIEAASLHAMKIGNAWGNSGERLSIARQDAERLLSDLQPVWTLYRETLAAYMPAFTSEAEYLKTAGILIAEADRIVSTLERHGGRLAAPKGPAVNRQ